MLYVYEQRREDIARMELKRMNTALSDTARAKYLFGGIFESKNSSFSLLS